ncbi:hypothetical protein MACH18_02540 [Phaeobacter italicus]|nr:hypothetical protein MACH18_02540 [Phaeobacter italicus]
MAGRLLSVSLATMHRAGNRSNTAAGRPRGNGAGAPNPPPARPLPEGALLTSGATPHIRPPIRQPGVAPKADIKIKVAQDLVRLFARILCKPTASFTSEWERLRFLRLRTRKCDKFSRTFKDVHDTCVVETGKEPECQRSNS